MKNLYSLISSFEFVLQEAIWKILVKSVPIALPYKWLKVNYKHKNSIHRSQLGIMDGVLWAEAVCARFLIVVYSTPHMNKMFMFNPSVDDLKLINLMDIVLILYEIQIKWYNTLDWRGLLIQCYKATIITQ